MTDPNNRLGEFIRSLLRMHKMKAYELADEIGVAPTTISKIMNGTIRPKKETFAKICDQFGPTEEAKRRLIEIYTGTELQEETNTESTANPLRPIAPGIASPEKHLSEKAKALAFENQVDSELQKLQRLCKKFDITPLTYKRHPLTETCTTDFLIEQDGELIALECRFHPIADLQAEADIALCIRKQLGCTSAFIIVPDSNGIISATMQNGIKIRALSRLADCTSGTVK